MLVKDLCYRGQGFLGQHGKETKTSWDTLSYTLIQAHNVYQHMTAVQEANRRYENGIKPKMVMDPHGHIIFSDLVDKIFSLKDRQKSLELIDYHTKFWMQLKAGQGFSGKKAINAHTMSDQHFDGEFGTNAAKDEKPKKVQMTSMFDNLFEVANCDTKDDPEIDEVIEDTDDLMAEIID